MFSRTVLLTFAALAAYGQIGLPGQYPGQYPPGRNPRQGPYPNDPNDPRNDPRNRQPAGSRRDNSRDRVATVNTSGILRRFAGNQLVIESDDHRVIWYRLSDKATVEKNGKAAELNSFGLGDYLSVDSTEDDQGIYTAMTVEWRKAATPADAGHARETWDLPKIANVQTASAKGGTAKREITRDPGDDRPILRRKNPEPLPADTPAAEPAQSPAPSSDAPPAPAAAPRETPTKDAVAQDDIDPRPTTTLRPPDPKPDADDDGPPTLRRGAPPARRALVIAPPPAPVATTSGESRGAAPAAVAVAPPPPTPIPIDDDPVLTKARDAAAQYSETLPNFFAQQITTRYQTDNPKRGWDVHDVVTADVAYEGGRESYKNIKVGNKAVNTAMEDIEGSRSTGEFSTIMQDLMDPANGVAFRRNGTDTIHNRSSYVYRFEVAREISRWRIESPSQLYYPAYRGNVWIDKETYRVLRIEQEGRNMPVMFPFDTVESSTDYDLVRLGTPQQFLLPVEAEVLSCQRGSSICNRNRIEFRNYRKFGAESSITFTEKP
ncbi:MAG TPA: hypothetical protein VN841_24470 [Bryobacteraceae bacterium]|nr:hypothetical protein [Bryobacteraceae bacterium]